MLLAFFIVLNALSSFEEVRVHPVMESLEQVFSTDAREMDVKPSVTPDPLKNIREGETVERLDALFKAQIVNFKPVVKSSTMGVMQVSIPLDKFVKAIMAVGQEDIMKTQTKVAPRNFFLPTLVSILKSNQENVPYRMDMIFPVSDNPAKLVNESPQEYRDMMKQAGILVRRLEQAGLEEKLMSIGLGKVQNYENGQPMVEVYFRRHEPFSPVVDGEETP